MKVAFSFAPLTSAPSLACRAAACTAVNMRRSSRLGRSVKREDEAHERTPRAAHVKREATIASPTPAPRSRKRTRSPKGGRIKKESSQASEARTIDDIEDACGRAPSESTARCVTGLLRSEYGARKQKSSQASQSVLDSLVATMLSQATTGVNSRRAFGNLKTTFPSWEEALSGGEKGIADAIRVGGLADAKSARIVAILQRLQRERGELSLEYLRDAENDEVKRVLCALPGVGPKTAACVLMFCLGRAEFPVDTHVRRISGRMGWSGMGDSAEKVYDTLNAALPGDVKYELHVLLISHGRAVCKARVPQCDACVLRDECRFYANGIKERNEKELEEDLGEEVKMELEVKEAKEELKVDEVKKETKIEVKTDAKQEAKKEGEESEGGGQYGTIGKK